MEEGEVNQAAPVLPSRPRFLLRDATQTKLNDDFLLGSRGPGTNEGDFLLMPHLAEIYPGCLGGWICEPIARDTSAIDVHRARGVSAIF